MRYAQSLIIVLAAGQAAAAAAAMAGERSELRTVPAAIVGQNSPGRQAIKNAPTASAVSSLDRVASAVDGAESSHGKDIAMWRPDPSGPQGPMQVSEAAATDVGGGDRFDPGQNREIGRAYLAQLHWRYGNWPDAIAAYNWGLGNMDAWLKAGRPPDKFLAGVAVYLRRVLHESGLCEDPSTKQVRRPPAKLLQANQPSRVIENQKMTSEPEEAPELAPDSLINSGCLASAAWSGAQGVFVAPSRFFKKLDQAMQLAVLHSGRSR